MKFFALGRLKNHNVPHLHPNSTVFIPLDRLQLKIYAFSGALDLEEPAHTLINTWSVYHRST